MIKTSKIFSLAASLGLILMGVSCSRNTQSNLENSERGQWVNSTLAKMTVEEKIGQMTQLNIDMIMMGEWFNLERPYTLDSAALKQVILDYHVGSMLNSVGEALDLPTWHGIQFAIQDMAVNQSRLGIPVVYGIDAIHGVNYTSGNSLTPQPLAQAATFNRSLVEAMAEGTAYEVRASGIPWNFSPVLDVMRQPLWSRVFETYGESPYVVSEMGAAVIRGYEGDSVSDPYRVAACMKHFIGYSKPTTGRDRTPTQIGPIEMREIFLPPFRRAIEEGAHTVMINSGEINGIPVHANPVILTQLLRDELGFEGLAVTDWEDIIKLHQFHKTAPTLKDAVKQAIDAGIDMSMVPLGFEFNQLLLELVQEGSISESRLDVSVRRILNLKWDLGLMRDPFFWMNHDYSDFGSDRFASLHQQAAEESMTLLKNEAVLPLRADQRILVTGPGSHHIKALMGAWSRSWLGRDSIEETAGTLTIYEALQQTFDHVSWMDGCGYYSNYNALPNGARLSNKYDAIIMCIADEPGTEKPGDINSLNLPQNQIDWIRALEQSGLPLILVLVENRPMIIEKVEPLADAIIHAYQPGSQGAPALADLLLGKVDFSGKLPFTYPRHANALVLYDHKSTEKLDVDFSLNAFNPQYELGSGMSYAEFSYDGITLSDSVFNAGDTLVASVEITNRGDHSCKHAVIAFGVDHYASVTPSAREVIGFEKETWEAGETKTVVFKFTAEDFSLINAELQRVIEPGAFSIELGNLSATFDIQ